MGFIFNFFRLPQPTTSLLNSFAVHASLGPRYGNLVMFRLNVQKFYFVSIFQNGHILS
jgi:hypothetical protein